MHAFRRYAPLLASVLVLSSCSMARFGYDALPTWVHWQAEKYFDLDDAQREIVTRRVDELHQWHRRTQLPKYVAFLRTVNDEMREPVAAEDIGRWRDRAAEAWQVTAERLAPGVAELALTLREEQIERLRDRLDDGNEKARKEFLPKGEGAREKARLDRVVKRAEFFLGHVGRDQKRALAPVVAAMPSDEEAWLAERVQRQHRLVALLQKIRREKPPRDEAVQWTRDYLMTMWESRDQRRRHALERAIAASDALSADLLSQATPKQREHLEKLIAGFADDFEKLASRRGGGAAHGRHEQARTSP